ncbi:TPA: hypothetical protein JD320_001590 [Citrobacter koseri]|uniref:hypothetical protein n=1 Tax=Citrobacter koseri TaxID=545 RepID=UPI001A1AB33C|nr:hypothetical protein [Citrobacter koseri]HDQ2604341.1 hypothetical protein [Citrobacter koseri]
MEIKLIKYWKVELFEQQKSGSLVSLTQFKKPFFTGYSKELIRPEKLQGGDFITLAPSPDFVDVHSIRTYRVDEIKCTPVYEQEIDSFAEAAEPLIKWMAENSNPQSHVVVTSACAELFHGERIHRNDKFLKY